ncbi:putative E3 ubiquitin-protein ligase ZFP1 [Tasmannia lanceolata]|uniref:putative E3 ubiquitin-protein ligase ZFP1 n=1 Tax=Tasmannia lanceolata TaxID=3420 RepID=UPI004062AEE4
MGQRNMLCTHQMLDLELEQGQTHLHPESCTLLGNIVDFPYPNMHPLLTATGNTSLDLRHLPDHQDSSIFYANQNNSLQHRHPVTNFDLNSAPTPNFSNNPYMIPSSATGICQVTNLDLNSAPPSSNFSNNPYTTASRICHMPLNHGASDHVPSSSNHGVVGVTIDEYGRNIHLMDNARGSCKRKNAEGGVPGNYYYVNGSASSSSQSSICLSLNNPGVQQQWEESFEPPGVGVLDAAAFPLSVGSGSLSIGEGSQRSVRSRSTSINLHLDSAVAHHHHNPLLQGNYMGRSFHPSNNAWVESFGSNGADGVCSNWNYTPAMPYLHGRSVNGGPLENGSVSGQGYHDSNRNSAILLQPPSMHHHRPHYPPPMQGMRGHSYSYHSLMPMPSYGHPTNNNLHHGTPNPSWDSLESGSRYPRSFPSSGDRIYRPHRRVPQAAPEYINGRMRFLSSEDVAILEISGFYGVGNFIDQHRDMRLDIDGMSYEELLALEERIGDVSTGLSEEFILTCLKTRPHVLCATSTPPDQLEGTTKENETCIICQIGFEENEQIGTLDCGHDYHADCIKQWLLLKNVCPICKTSALSVDKRQG